MTHDAADNRHAPKKRKLTLKVKKAKLNTNPANASPAPAQSPRGIKPIVRIKPTEKLSRRELPQPPSRQPAAKKVDQLRQANAQRQAAKTQNRLKKQPRKQRPSQEKKRSATGGMKYVFDKKAEAENDGDPQDLDTIAINSDYMESKNLVVEPKRGIVSELLKKVTKQRPPSGFDEFVRRAGETTLKTILPKKADLPHRYEYDRQLGQGGMGQVIAVHDQDVRRTIAMKLLLPGATEQKSVVERFIDEIQIAGQLEHPNILPIYDIGSVSGEPYFTMKYIEGFTLKHVFDEMRRGNKEMQAEFTLTKLLQIFQQICLGLAYAHDKDVIHRDIKPDNVMIGYFGEVLIVDWGLAMVVGHHNPKESERQRRVTTSRMKSIKDSKTGRVTGTPAYMSPEQARGLTHELSARSDIYALGCLLYEMLTLRVPLRGKNTLETLTKCVYEDPKPPSQRPQRLNREIPAIFDEICLKALAKKPEDRYQSAEELAESVQSIIDGSEDRARRQREASEYLQKGFDEVRVFFDLKRSIETYKTKLKDLRESTKPWAPISEKQPIWDIEDQIDELKRRQTEVVEAAHDAFDAVLGFIPDHDGARAAKADLFWEYYLEAERTGDRILQAHFKARVLAFHAKKFENYFDQAGPVTLDVQPQPDSLFAVRLEEKNRILTATETVAIKPDQTTVNTLEPGTYVLNATHPDCDLLEIPFTLKRKQSLHIAARLIAAGAIGRTFAYIHGGQLEAGGDPDAPGSLPWQEVDVQSFFLARRPVTAGEYLEFLNELHQHDPNLAAHRTPRMRADGQSLWPLLASGYSFTNLNFRGQVWDANWPIFGISCLDAEAYCQWYAVRYGYPVRLPTEFEWEWASRGPGALIYPWGSRFDPNFCKMKLSCEGEPAPAVVGRHPQDRSIYGVNDLAGGVHEWCQGLYDEDRGMRVLKGGSWLSPASQCRLAARIGDQPYDRHGSYGFRLAIDFDSLVQ